MGGYVIVKTELKKMITNKKFRDTRTGEIVTQFNILEIKFMEEINENDE